MVYPMFVLPRERHAQRDDAFNAVAVVSVAKAFGDFPIFRRPRVLKLA